MQRVLAVRMDLGTHEWINDCPGVYEISRPVEYEAHQLHVIILLYIHSLCFVTATIRILSNQLRSERQIIGVRSADPLLYSMQLH